MAETDRDRTARYYGSKAAGKLAIDDSGIAELISTAAEDADVDLDWSAQGDAHERIEMRLREAAKQIATEEIRAALEDDE